MRELSRQPFTIVGGFFACIGLLWKGIEPEGSGLDGIELGDERTVPPGENRPPPERTVPLFLHE